MTKDKLWLFYVKRNPSFLNSDELVKINSKGLEKLFSLTYDQGHKEGYEKGKKEKSAFENIFGNNLFGT